MYVNACVYMRVGVSMYMRGCGCERRPQLTQGKLGRDLQSHPKDFLLGTESAQNLDAGGNRPQSARKAYHLTGVGLSPRSSKSLLPSSTNP